MHWYAILPTQLSIQCTTAHHQILLRARQHQTASGAKAADSQIQWTAGIATDRGSATVAHILIITAAAKAETRSRARASETQMKKAADGEASTERAKAMQICRNGSASADDAERAATGLERATACSSSARSWIPQEAKVCARAAAGMGEETATSPRRYQIGVSTTVASLAQPRPAAREYRMRI